MQEQNDNTNTSHHDHGSASRYFLGIVVLFFGVVYLLKELGYFETIPWRWDLLWPILIIIAGLTLLVRGRWDSALLGLIVGLGFTGLLLHILTAGAVWQQLGF